MLPQIPLGSVWVSHLPASGCTGAGSQRPTCTAKGCILCCRRETTAVKPQECCRTSEQGAEGERGREKGGGKPPGRFSGPKAGVEMLPFP